MISQVYDSFLMGFAQRAVDWVQDDFKVVLVSSDYQPDASHRTRADLGDYELGTTLGYDRGGKRLRSRSLEAADRGVLLAAADVSWTNFSGQFRYAVICQDTGAGRAQDILVSYADMGDQNIQNATVVLDYSVDGVCLFASDEEEQ